LANITDAVSPPPGLYYNNYTQWYTTHHNYGASGEKLPGNLQINSLLSLHQLVYLTPIRLLNGNVHFTTIMPLVEISATGGQPATPSVNPGIAGDLTVGAGIQWKERKVFHHPLWQRVEFDITLPTGAHDADYQVNASGHLYALAMYYTFTYFLTDKLSFGSRNQVNYNFNVLHTDSRPGMFYNVNFAVQYKVFQQVQAGLAGYYLKQFTQDAYAGNRHYYQENFNIADTREQVLGVGPGLSYLTSGGVFLEGKIFYEQAAVNRPAGTRPTFRVVLPIR
jgi:hypothetical protein